jgi:predicted DCC family thiol-disulfide oxidoreductase YuxK
VSLRFGRLQSGGRTLVRLWNTFFFTPQSATPIALYRIIYGLLVIANLTMLHGDWLTWFGANGLVRVDTLRKLSPRLKLDLMWMPLYDDVWIQVFFWVFLLFAVFLTAGFLSRLSSVVVFLFISVIIRRNSYISNGGDYLLLFTGFFLIFAPTGAAISFDRLLRIWRGHEGIERQPRWPWAQRMIQIQTALVYFSAFCWKTLGSDWRDGTALYYTTRLVQFQRFPTPTLENGLVLRLATWSTLFIEFAVGVLVWVRRVRYWVLLLGVCLHLAIEYSMNIPLFQWIAMAGYVTFIDPGDLSRAWTWVRRHFGVRLGDPVDVVYDGSCARTTRLADVLRAIDVLGRLNVVDLNSSKAGNSWPALPDAPGRARLLISRRGTVYEGFKGILAISRLVPLLWAMAPLSVVFCQPKASFRVAKTVK